MLPLLNSAAIVQCAHGGIVPMIPVGKRPMVGGAPGMVPSDLLGKTANGCQRKHPCVITGVIAGISTKIDYSGQMALTQGVVCSTTSGSPTVPCGVPGQQKVLGV